MINAVGAPQSLLLLGGTSDIALAIAHRYARPGLRIVLAARPSDRRTAAATELKSVGCEVTEVDLDARDHDSHAATIDLAFAGGDIDIAVIAFGLLGDPERAWQDPDLALELAEVNYAAPVHLGVLLGQRCRPRHTAGSSRCPASRANGSGAPTSSTARPRLAWTVSSSGLGEALRDHGVRVLVVRPGFVKSKMTSGLDEIPLSVTPDDVAEAITDAIQSKRELIWVPGPLRAVMSGLRHVPRPLFRKLPL